MKSKEPVINFEFKGKNYSLQVTATELYESGGLISLPDGTLLVFDSWLESIPPQPRGLRQVTPQELAALTGMEVPVEVAAEVKLN
jgi:hypothetical protein